MTTVRTRLSPATRREQLLDLGVRLLSDRPLDEVTIDVLSEEAGVSRGLLYHYFGGKQQFHAAVVRRAADELIAVTAPGDDPDPSARLRGSLAAYLDYVLHNQAGYRSLLRAAAGSAELRAIYDDSRAALGDRIFTDPESLALLGIDDTPLNRLLVRGWQAMTEEVVLAWVQHPDGTDREDLLTRLAGALSAVL